MSFCWPLLESMITRMLLVAVSSCGFSRSWQPPVTGSTISNYIIKVVGFVPKIKAGDGNGTLIFQSPRLNSVLPKKNPTPQGRDCHRAR